MAQHGPLGGQWAGDDTAQPGMRVDACVGACRDQQVVLRRARLDQNDITRFDRAAHIGRIHALTDGEQRGNIDIAQAVCRRKRELQACNSEAVFHQAHAIQTSGGVTPVQAEP